MRSRSPCTRCRTWAARPGCSRTASGASRATANEAALRRSSRPLWLFGAGYLTLKLVPFLMGLAIMGLIWRFLEGNFNRTAAVIGVLIFALAPPTLPVLAPGQGQPLRGPAFLFLPVVLIFEASRRERRAAGCSAPG